MSTAEMLFWCLVGFAGAVACFVLAAAWLCCWIADQDQQERQARHIEWMENQDGEGWE